MKNSETEGPEHNRYAVHFICNRDVLKHGES